MKTYNISRIPDGFSQPTYDELLLSGYTQGYEDGYNRGTEECKPFNERYFTIESRVEGIVTVPDRVNYYRRNFQEWVAVPSGGTLVDVGPGDTVEMKGDGGMGHLFEGVAMPDEYIAYGNILSLVYGDDFAYKYRIAPEGSPIEGQFMYAFAGNTGLTDVSNLVLQATVLTRYCYGHMFNGCTSLETTPVLPAMTLAEGCYASMFYGCSSLVSAPELPATQLADDCYNNMFAGCTGLASAPALPATTLANNCYYGMFHSCESLTAAPALPATALTTSCYSFMFRGCTGLTTAPELPAAELMERCYESLFWGCPNINNIKCLATDMTAGNCLLNWVYGVAANGTFTKASSATWETGVSGIPEGWTIQDA